MEEKLREIIHGPILDRYRYLDEALESEDKTLKAIIQLFNDEVIGPYEAPDSYGHEGSEMPKQIYDRKIRNLFRDQLREKLG